MAVLDRLTRVKLSHGSISATEVFVGGSGPSVLLIGGLYSNYTIWSGVLDHLLINYRVVIYHPPGHGDSALPSNSLTFAAVSQSIKIALEATGVSAPVATIGWSLGGVLALQLALDFPDLVNRLLIVSSTPRTTYSSAKENFLHIQQMIRNARGKSWLRGYMDGQETLSAPAVKAYQDLLDQFDFRRRITGIRHPCTIVSGEQDLFTPVFLSEEINGCIRASSLVRIPDGDHFLLSSHPDLVYSTFTALVASV
jgi:pimeloyl-ACP methyl ester carboxylesterase